MVINNLYVSNYNITERSSEVWKRVAWLQCYTSLLYLTISLCNLVLSLLNFVISHCNFVISLRNLVISLCNLVISLRHFVTLPRNGAPMMRGCEMATMGHPTLYLKPIKSLMVLLSACVTFIPALHVSWGT